MVEEEPPIRRRVGAKAKTSDSVGAHGAASSAPGRSSSVGSWVGLPAKKGKCTGKDKDHPTDPSPAGPKQPDGPPGWNPSSGLGPTTPPCKAKPDPTPRQPPVAPPPHRALAPNSQPSRYTVSVRSFKPKQVSEHQPPVTPGVSLSPATPRQRVLPLVHRQIRTLIRQIQRKSTVIQHHVKRRRR